LREGLGDGVVCDATIARVREHGRPHPTALIPVQALTLSEATLASCTSSPTGANGWVSFTSPVVASREVTRTG
jgi:hypothetical protein